MPERWLLCFPATVSLTQMLIGDFSSVCRGREIRNTRETAALLSHCCIFDGDADRCFFFCLCAEGGRSGTPEGRPPGSLGSASARARHVLSWGAVTRDGNAGVCLADRSCHRHHFWKIYHSTGNAFVASFFLFFFLFFFFFSRKRRSWNIQSWADWSDCLSSWTCEWAPRFSEEIIL